MRPDRIVEAEQKEIAPAATNAAATSAPDDLSSLWVLVAVNLVPIAGVAFWGWRVHEIVFLYWIENLVIGVFNVLRMATVVPAEKVGGEYQPVKLTAGELLFGKLYFICFFLVHYGLFCYVHGVGLVSIFPPADGVRRYLSGYFSGFEVLVGMLSEPHSLFAIAAIVAGHAWSYLRYYIGTGEYRRANLGELIYQPYKRVGVTHLFIFAGAFGLQSIGSPLLAMVVFIALKIGFDVYYHRREHGPQGARSD